MEANKNISQLSEQLTIVWLVRIFEHLEVFHELLEVRGEVFEEEPVVVLLLHQADLFTQHIAIALINRGSSWGPIPFHI